MNQEHYLQPDWPVASNVHAYTTTRQGGISSIPYDSFNLADHVGDDDNHVNSNREKLSKDLGLPHPPKWIKQVHGTHVVKAETIKNVPEADASMTIKADVVCAVLTADCLPVLLCNRQGNEVAAIHAGWRGLAAGIIENTINAMQTPGKDLLAWLGPANGPTAYEIGQDAYDQLTKADSKSASAFQPLHDNKWLGNLYELAKIRLNTAGVKNIYGGNFCTFSDSERFFSYRRAGGTTGRMASLIWFS